MRIATQDATSLHRLFVFTSRCLVSTPGVFECPNLRSGSGAFCSAKSTLYMALFLKTGGQVDQVNRLVPNVPLEHIEAVSAVQKVLLHCPFQPAATHR